jgi:hypothetical protein
MKKFLIIIGSGFLVLVFLIACFIGYAVYQGQGLDASSKAYVEANILPIISTWSKDALLKRASPELLKSVNEKSEEFDQLFKKLSKLGPMQKFGEVKGESNVAYTTQNGKVTSAAYVTAAKFEKGDVRIFIRLIQLSGHWQILSFYVDSPLFLQ